MRRQMEMQQEAEYRQRLIEQQERNRFLNELEYRNKVHRLQEIQELQAAQQQRQQGLNQLLTSQNPSRILEMELLRRNGLQAPPEDSRTSSLSEDLLLQRHQQLMQDQLLGRSQTLVTQQLLQDSVGAAQRLEQEEILAGLQSSANILPNQAILRQQHEQAILRQTSNDRFVDSGDVQLEALLMKNLDRQRALEDALINQAQRASGRTYGDVDDDEPPTRTEHSSEAGHAAALQGRAVNNEPRIIPPKTTEASIEDRRSAAAPPKPKIGSSIEKITEKKYSDNKAALDKELEDRVANLLENKVAVDKYLVDKELEERLARETFEKAKKEVEEKLRRDTQMRIDAMKAARLREEEAARADAKGKAAWYKAKAAAEAKTRKVNKTPKASPKFIKKRKKSDDLLGSEDSKKKKKKKKSTINHVLIKKVLSKPKALSKKDDKKETKSATSPKKSVHDISVAAKEDAQLESPIREQSVIDFLGLDNGPKKLGFKSNIKKKKSKDNKINHAEAYNDGQAANIVFNFKKNNDVSTHEIRKAKKWSKQSKSLVTTYPVIKPEKIPFISPGLKFNIPSLPIEPELSDAEIANLIPPGISIANAEMAISLASGCAQIEDGTVHATRRLAPTDDMIYVKSERRIFKPKKSKGKDDSWWPSTATIRKERRKLKGAGDEEDTDEENDVTIDSMPGVSFVKAGIEAAEDRLARSVEPGVWEKLPHCRLYDELHDGKKKFTPKFCCQTTETFPFEVMVCCNVCSTWRHAQCGGHHKRYSAESVDPSNIRFEPICDQCYLEKPLIENNPTAATRIDRQRNEHLRRVNATNAVMRQFAFGKHSGQYKWPLGSVSVTHMSAHTRSVQARHEKAEKQWSEMAHRLAAGTEVRPRERQRVRTRELERIMNSVEEAGKFHYTFGMISHSC